MLAVWQEVVTVPDRNPELSECPSCGSPAFVQWFNDDYCFAACSKGVEYGPAGCSLAEADITKWTVFDNEKDAALHWNEICEKIKTGKLCPECQGEIMEDLGQGYYHCLMCRTVNHYGKPLTEDEWDEAAERIKKEAKMKEKSCVNCMNASVTEEQGATFVLCDFDADCNYIDDPEKRAAKCPDFEPVEEKNG